MRWLIKHTPRKKENHDNLDTSQWSQWERINPTNFNETEKEFKKDFILENNRHLSINKTTKKHFKIHDYQWPKLPKSISDKQSSAIKLIKSKSTKNEPTKLINRSIESRSWFVA